MKGVRLEFYSGFSWALPRAFGSALHACRFEQGDVLYSDRGAYEANAKAGSPQHHIQIFEPSRSTRALSGESEGQRFHANWDSAVKLEHVEYQAGRPGSEAERETVETTQGRLFMCLWRGDVGWLTPDSEHTEAPAHPLLLRDLHSRLEEALPVLRKRAARSKWATHLFAQAFDDASDASRIKSQATLQLLESHYRTRCIDLSPEQAGLSGGKGFHPALVVRGMALEAPDTDRVREILKGLLYSGGSGNGSPGVEVEVEVEVEIEEVAEDESEVTGGTEGKGARDRFQLARHGALVTLG